MGEPGLPEGDPGWNASALSELIALLLSVDTLEEALQRLAEMAVAVIPDGPSCGITVIRQGQPVTAVYAGPVPKDLHDEQYRLGDGPGPEALRTGQIVISQDLAAEQRWGKWPAAAVAENVYGAYAHPLEVEGRVTGALNLYAHGRNLFPVPVQRVARQFALPAMRLLDGVVRRLSHEEVIGQLHEAMDSRTTVGQATGIIMARRRCSPQEALNLLIRISNDRNVKLRDLASAVVEAVTSGGELPL